MQLIQHRCNTREKLLKTPNDLGIEVDIRSQGDRLVIHHDPYIEGEDFEAWVKEYQHRTLILNVKEEGLENRLLNLMKRHKIEDFFFLDQSFPFLIRTANSGERRCAVRVSEFEALESALSLASKIDWVWVDCFTYFPLSSSDAHKLQEAGLKLCLVSPELQGRVGEEEIVNLRQLLHRRGIQPEAVCTKQPEFWL